MAARTRHCHLVEHAEEIHVETGGKRLGCSLVGIELLPFVERFLRMTKDVFDIGIKPKAFGPRARVALVRQRQLIAQVAKTIVHRRGGKHEHLGGYAVAHHSVEQALIAALFDFLAVFGRFGGIVAIAEIMALVDDNQVVCAPVDGFKVEARCRCATFARKVGMVKHVVAQAVFGYGVVTLIVAIHQPVVAELLGTQHQDVAV